MVLERFAVKFKTPEKAAEFKETFEKCQKEIAAGGNTAASPKKEEVKSNSTGSNSGNIFGGKPANVPTSKTKVSGILFFL